MNINKVGELGMSMVSGTKADQSVSNTESNRNSSFYKDIQRAAEKAERQQANEADRAQRPDKDAITDDAAAQGMERQENVTQQDETITNEGMAQDAPEDMAEDPIAMAVLAAMQIMQAAQQHNTGAQEAQTDAAQQAVAALSMLEQDANKEQQDVMPDMAALTDGEEPLEAPKTAATQDAKFVEQVFDEIKQAVVSNDAERTVSALTQTDAAQDAPEGLPQGEYDNLHTEQTNTGEPVKQHADTTGGHTAPMQDSAQSAPIEVAFDKGEIAPRAAQNAFFEGVLDQVQTAVGEQQSEIYVRLKPDVLGGLAIHLVMTEEGVSAQVKTSSQHLQAMVSAEVASLEAALRDRGVNIVEMNVIYEQSASNQYLDQQRQHHQPSDSGSRGGSRQVMRVADDGIPYDKLYESMVPTEMSAQEGVEYTA